MTVRELIKLLETMPPDKKILVDHGEYQYNWVPAVKVSVEWAWGIDGVLIQ